MTLLLLFLRLCLAHWESSMNGSDDDYCCRRRESIFHGSMKLKLGKNSYSCNNADVNYVFACEWWLMRKSSWMMARLFHS